MRSLSLPAIAAVLACSCGGNSTPAGSGENPGGENPGGAGGAGATGGAGGTTSTEIVHAPNPIPAGPNACSCAMSPELTALACDAAEGPMTWSQPFITPDGESVVFRKCNTMIPTVSPRCTTFRWTPSGVERLGDASVLDMSRDGRAILWQEDGGEVALHRLGGGTTPIPLAEGARVHMLLSADGTKVVRLDDQAGVLRRWTEAGGWQDVAQVDSAGSRNDGWVRAVSPDGTSVIGFMQTNSGYVSFRWREAVGVERLDSDPALDGDTVSPAALSEDGSVVVGIGRRPAQASVVRWAPDDYQILAPAQNQDFYPFAQVSQGYVETTPDGSVLAATIASSGPQSLHAWRYSIEDGETLLSAESPVIVTDMTPDGRVIIGANIQRPEGDFSSGPKPEEGIKWVLQPAVPDQPPSFSSVTFSSALQSQGVDVTGWELSTPSGVSDAGRVVFGIALCGGVRTLYRWLSPP